MSDDPPPSKTLGDEPGAPEPEGAADAATESDASTADSEPQPKTLGDAEPVAKTLGDAEEPAEAPAKETAEEPAKEPADEPAAEPAAKTLGGGSDAEAPSADELTPKELGDPDAVVQPSDDDARDAAAAAGETHKTLYALREAERLLVPTYLDLPDHVLVLSEAERDAAIQAVEAGADPGDLRAKVAAHKAKDSGPSDPPASPPGSSEPPPVRDPELPDPALSTRVIGGVYLLLGLLGAWWLGSAAFGEGLDVAIENWRLKVLLRLVAVGLPLYPALLGGFALGTGREPSTRTLHAVTGVSFPINPLGLPFRLHWFSLLAAIYLRELKATFTRPVAYFALFGFFVISGLLFVALLQYYGGSDTLGQDFSKPASFFVTANWQLYLAMAFLCPAITMRLVAEERSSGSLENLLTTEVTHIQVTLGKYLGALSFFAALILANLVYMVVLRGYAIEWDWGPVLSAYLGLSLMGGLFLAIGLSTSAWSQSQVVAFVVACPLILLCLLNGIVLNMSPGDSIEAIVRHTNAPGLQNLFAKGVVELKALVYYLSATWFFLFVAVRGVASHRWK